MNDEEINTIEDETPEEFPSDYAEALNSTPTDVRDFMWSDAFEFILKAIGDTYKLNDNQRDVVKRVTMETLVGTITPVSRQIRLSDVGITGELQDNILEAINEEIVSRALGQIELYNELNEEEKEEVEQEKKDVSPAQALANIQERLTKPSVVAPITRDYSVSRSAETKIEPEAPRTPSIDIYREVPEK
jgi:hypothetical protein